MPKSLSQCVTEFMMSQEVARLAETTQKRQATVLNLLVKEDRQRRQGNAKPSPAVLRPSDPVSRVDQGAIDAALYRVLGHVTVSTLNAYRTDFRRFGKWLVSRGHVKINPASHLLNVKTETPPSKRKPVANNKAHRVIDVANNIHPRDGMTAMLILYTGLRSAEVAELRWGNLDLESGSFTAKRTKVNDWHQSFIAPPLLKALLDWKEWVKTRMDQEIDPDWFVVPARAHRGDITGHHRMNSEWPIVPWRKQTHIRKRVKQWLEEIGETNLNGRAAHTLRRTAANLVMAVPGADIRTAQRFLGHKSVSMTELYLDQDVMAQRLQNAMQHLNIEAAEPDLNTEE